MMLVPLVLVLVAGLVGCASVSAPETDAKQKVVSTPYQSRHGIATESSIEARVSDDSHHQNLQGYCNPIHDFATGGPYHALHWARDGDSLVFNHGSILYAVDTQGTRLRELVDADPRPSGNWTSSFPFGFSFDVSPDGTQVAYSSCEFLDSGVYPEVALRRYEIALVNMDGSGHQRLTDNQRNDHMPVWSPDGRNLAFVANPRSGRFSVIALYTMAADGSDETLIYFPKPFYDYVLFLPPVWSPNGKFIAILTRGQIRNPTLRILHLGESEAALIAEVGASIVEGYFWPLPSWSPDGTHLVFVKADLEGRFGGIYVVQPDGTDLRQVLEPQESDRDSRDIHQVLWSPDGSEILAVSEQRLYFLQPDGSGVRTVDLLGTDAFFYTNSGIIAAWSPDSARIALYVPFDESDNNVQFQLYTLARDGTDKRDLATLDENGNLAPANPPTEES